MRTTTQSNDDFLAIIAFEAEAIALRHGVQWGSEAAEILVEKIVARFGGIQIYIPRQRFSERLNRNREIKRLFNGLNVKKLARQFDLSERSVRRILQKKI